MHERAWREACYRLLLPVLIDEDGIGVRIYSYEVCRYRCRFMSLCDQHNPLRLEPPLQLPLISRPRHLTTLLIHPELNVSMFLLNMLWNSPITVSLSRRIGRAGGWKRLWRAAGVFGLEAVWSARPMSLGVIPISL